MATETNGTQGQNSNDAATGVPPGVSQDAKVALDAKKAGILAKVRAGDPERAGRETSQQGDSGSDGVHAPGKAGSTPAPATPAAGTPATPAPTAVETAIAALTAQVAALAAAREVPKPKEEPATQVEDKHAALMAAIEGDVGAIFDLIPGLTIEKLAEAHLRRTDNPAHGELTEHGKQLAALQKKIDDRDKADADTKAKTAAEQATKAGHDLVKAQIDADKGRWARLARSEENTAEGIGLAVDAGRKVVVELRKTKGEKWSPSDDEAKTILQDCLDGIEKDFAARATRYGAPDITPKAGAASAVVPERKGIPAAGSGGGAPRVPAEEKPPSGDLASKKAGILKRVRANAVRQPQD